MCKHRLVLAADRGISFEVGRQWGTARFIRPPDICIIGSVNFLPTFWDDPLALLLGNLFLLFISGVVCGGCLRRYPYYLSYFLVGHSFFPKPYNNLPFLHEFSGTKFSCVYFSMQYYNSDYLSVEQ